MTDPRPCSTCKAPVFDLKHSRTGKLAPIDAEPNPKGNIMINHEEGTYVIVSQVTVGERHMNHWATCRDAAHWRKRYSR
jgi:hypothetical protein